MDFIQVDTRSDITVIQINRAPCNAIVLECAEELEKAVMTAINSHSRAIVLTGSGQTFCAGMDLKVVPHYDLAQQRRLLMTANRAIGALYSCQKPTIAAVNGHAIGAGLMLALACDYRLVSNREGALFGLTEARAGIPFPASSAVILQDQLSPADVRFLTLYSKNVDVSRALGMSVFDERVEDSQLMTHAMGVAQDMGAIPADSYAKVKGQFRQQAVQQIQRIVEQRDDPMLEDWVTNDGGSAASSVLSNSPAM